MSDELPPCIHRGKRDDTGHVECRCDRLVPLPPLRGSIARPITVCLHPCPYAQVPNRNAIHVPPPPPTDWTACDHRGHETRTAKCRTCGNRDEIVSVFACSIYGECTIHMRDIKREDGTGRVAVCAGCEEFTG